MPRPTITRNDQNTTVEFGRSAFGKSFSAGIGSVRLCLRIRLPSTGISTLKRVSSRCMSGQPNRISGVGPPSLLSQWPSMAAILAGWCSRVLRPWASPITACIGATSSAIHMAIDSILRIAGLSRPRSRCQAAEAPTKNAVARKAATAMCISR
ncbi:hypothetical protein D3C76_1171030 [compost metagenome]